MSGGQLPRLARSSARLLPTVQTPPEYGRSTTEHANSTAGNVGTAGNVHSTAGVGHPQLATEDVFRSRSVRELLRTVAVYQVCAVDKIVR